MSKMKDSGVEWIGEIPVDWSITRNKNAFLCNKTLVGDNSNFLQLLSLTTKGIRKKDIENPIGKLPESFDTYQYVKSGNLVMCLFDLDCSAVFSGFSPYNGMISPAYRVLDCKKNIFPRYADYWFSYISDGRKFNQYAKNIRYTLSYNEFADLPLLLPNIPIQHRIADYLDDKCAKIDSIIEREQAVIEKLKAYKQSLITETVTKGLNPNVPMKDSGIEWIGEIPAHWETTILLALFKEHKLKNKGNVENNLLSLSYGKIIKRDISSNEGLLPASFESYNIVESGYIVFRLTDLQNDKRSLRTGFCKERGIITSAYVTIAPIAKDLSEYMHFLFHSYDICKVFYGMGDGVRQSMTYQDLKKIRVIRPPLVEQEAIANFLDQKCSAIDETITKKQSLIEKLNEYKKSLIYEVVTGKKEV